MLRALRNILFCKKLKIAKLDNIAKLVKLAGFNIEEINHKKGFIKILFSDLSQILLSLDKKTNTLRLETTVIFDVDVLNLKTFSNIAHMAMISGFAISGVVPTANKCVKVYLGKDTERALSIGKELRLMEKVLKQILQYLQNRVYQANATELDLSMFSQIDLYGFDPRTLGEQKDFIYLSWQNFIDEVSQAQSFSVAEVATTVEELIACAEFEDKNNMSLSEVGDIVLEELIWNRALLESEEDEYRVN